MTELSAEIKLLLGNIQRRVCEIAELQRQVEAKFHANSSDAARIKELESKGASDAKEGE